MGGLGLQEYLAPPTLHPLPDLQVPISCTYLQILIFYSPPDEK